MARQGLAAEVGHLWRVWPQGGRGGAGCDWEAERLDGESRVGIAMAGVVGLSRDSGVVVEAHGSEKG